MNESCIAIDTKSIDFNHLQTLTAFASSITVDKINEVGLQSGFAGDVVKVLKSSMISIVEQEGEKNIIINAEFTDNDGNEDGHAFIFVDKNGQISLDYPY